MAVREQAPEALGEAFRGAMGQLAAGVVMVTTLVDGRPWGLTMSACCSISMAPPLLMVAPAVSTVTARSIEDTGRFGVSVLGAGQLEVARFGAARGAPKFMAEFCRQTDDDGSELLQTPAVAGALAHVDCELTESVVAGDHVVCIGAVRSVVLDVGDAPLVYHDRDYHRLRPVRDGDALVVEAADGFQYPPW
jgi:flavin reductase (DIM6/NTAB) family NADH-FMN oxidoreductase RutF